MPEKHEHAARINSPDKYKKIRRENDKFGSGIDVIWGILDDGKTEVQAIRFDSSKFTADEARKWLKDHDYKPIEFEPATGKNMSNTIEYKTFRFNLLSTETKAVKDQNFGYIKGYASTFGNVDRGGDIVMRGAFVKSIEDYRVQGKKIPMCFQHSMMDMIGGFDPQTMREDEKGLYCEGAINLDVGRGKDVYALTKQGVIDSMSIGYTSDDYDFEPSGDDDGSMIRKLKQLNLWEISAVGIPMNPLARINDVKSSEDEINTVQINELLHIIKSEELEQGTKSYLISKLLHNGICSKKTALFLAEAVVPKLNIKTKTDSYFNKENQLKSAESILTETLHNYKNVMQIKESINILKSIQK